MAALVIQESLWQDFVATARQQRQKPERLAAKVLRDYLRRVADEQLLARSEKVARRSKLRMDQTEEVIRQFRRTRKKPVA